MDASQRTEVTAVLVEGALANAANDKELSRHDMKEKAGCVGCSISWMSKCLMTHSLVIEIYNV